MLFALACPVRCRGRGASSSRARCAKRALPCSLHEACVGGSFAGADVRVPACLPCALGMALRLGSSAKDLSRLQAQPHAKVCRLPLYDSAGLIPTYPAALRRGKACGADWVEIGAQCARLRVRPRAGTPCVTCKSIESTRRVWLHAERARCVCTGAAPGGAPPRSRPRTAGLRRPAAPCPPRPAPPLAPLQSQGSCCSMQARPPAAPCPCASQPARRRRAGPPPGRRRPLRPPAPPTRLWLLGHRSWPGRSPPPLAPLGAWAAMPAGSLAPGLPFAPRASPYPTTPPCPRTSRRGVAQRGSHAKAGWYCSRGYALSRLSSGSRHTRSLFRRTDLELYAPTKTLSDVRAPENDARKPLHRAPPPSPCARPPLARRAPPARNRGRRHVRSACLQH